MVRHNDRWLALCDYTETRILMFAGSPVTVFRLFNFCFGITHKPLHLFKRHWLKFSGHCHLISNFKSKDDLKVAHKTLSFLSFGISHTQHLYIFYVVSHSHSFSSSMKYYFTTYLCFSSWLTTSVCQHSYTNFSHSNQLEKGRFFFPHLLSCLFPPVQKLDWAYSKSRVWALISAVLISHKRAWLQRGNQALFKVMPPGVHCQR